MRLTNIILLYIRELCVVGSTPTIPSKMGCSTVGSAIVLLDVKITALTYPYCQNQMNFK